MIPSYRNQLLVIFLKTNKFFPVTWRVGIVMGWGQVKVTHRRLSEIYLSCYNLFLQFFYIQFFYMRLILISV